MKLFYKNIIFLFCFLLSIIGMSELWNLLKSLKYSMYPTKLSVSDLKNVLKYRGIDFNDVVEKKELWMLVNSTGWINSFELSLANEYSLTLGKCTSQSAVVIPSEELFNELVEDSKDSAWILMTIMPKSFSHVNDNDRRKLNEVWCSIQTIFKKFGVNMAILNCGKLYNLCWERGFHRSPFVLVLPRSRERVKDSVDFFIYPYHHSLLVSNPGGSGGVKHKHSPHSAPGVSAKVIQRSVVRWLRERLAHRVVRWKYTALSNDTFTLYNKTKTSSSTANFISVFRGSDLSQYNISLNNSLYHEFWQHSILDTSTPLSISANSVKFTGKVHFSVSSSPSDLPPPISAKLQPFSDAPLSHYLLLPSDDTVYQYGNQEGQTLSFESLQLFLRHVCPSTNDIFIWNLVLVNLFISFQAVFQNGSFVIRIGYYLWYFFIFNLVYCSLFLFVLSALNFSPVLSQFNHYLLGWWRRLALTKFVNHIRYLQLNQDIDLVLFLVTWCLFVLIIGKFHKDGDDTTPSQQRRDNTDTEVEGVRGLHGPILEPYDPEAGQQIAILTALGNFNLNLQQQPPIYISRLLKWSFQVPKTLATKLASRYKGDNKTTELARCPTRFTTSSALSSSSSASSSPELPFLTNTTPTTTAQWPNGYIFTEDCCICLQKYKTNEILCGLPCGHAFHDTCIHKWLVQWGKDDCPQCRWPAYKEKPN